MTRAELIKEKLTAALHPVSVEVVDDSARHAGHAGAKGLPAGETHFNVKVVAAAFEGKSRIDRHRLVNFILVNELKAGVHALAIDAKAPGE
jgi:BolA family transcriptional regulator, general stress-responsive regulator